MKINKADSRDKKRQRRIYGMRVDGSSVKVIQRTINKRAKRIERKE